MNMYLGSGRLPLCVVKRWWIRVLRSFKQILTLGSDAISCSAQPLSDHGFLVWIVQYGSSRASWKIAKIVRFMEGLLLKIYYIFSWDIKYQVQCIFASNINHCVSMLQKERDARLLQQTQLKLGLLSSCINYQIFLIFLCLKLKSCKARNTCEALLRQGDGVFLWSGFNETIRPLGSSLMMQTSFIL